MTNSDVPMAKAAANRASSASDIRRSFREKLQGDQRRVPSAIVLQTMPVAGSSA